MYLPWRISQWWAIGIRLGGMFFVSCFSVSKGVLALVVRPILSDTRNTWVSTGIFGLLNITAIITLAVLRPTPLSSCSLSIVSGTWLWNFSTNVFAIETKCFALLLG